MKGERFVHKKGGGVIWGIESGVGADCYLSRDSTIEGRTFLSCKTSVYASAIKDSSISYSEIEGSAIENGQIAGAIIENSAISEVIVRGNSRRAIVEDSILSDHVVVEGCRVRNVNLEGPYLLHSDLDKTPRTFLMEEEGLHLGVVECGCRPGVKSGIIGCCCRPLSVWIERRELLRRIFQKRNWSGYQIDIFHELFKEWQS